MVQSSASITIASQQMACGNLAIRVGSASKRHLMKLVAWAAILIICSEQVAAFDGEVKRDFLQYFHIELRSP